MIFVFDLDGTICYKGQPITEKILHVLECLQVNGHTVIFASARPIRDMLPILNPRFHAYTMIGGNGSLVSENGQLTYSTSFTSHQTHSIKSLLNEYDATYLIDGEWDYSYTGSPDHPILTQVDPARLAKMVPLEAHEAIVKVLVLTANAMEQLADKITLLDVVVHTHRNENVLDISPNNIHKWAALKKLNIGREQYIAFGNDANDISMFKNAAHSVMIGYHEELAQYATEAIPLEENIEDKIVEKLNYLSTIYN
ncbi:HAD-IIB family hydrolase [Cohnella abietis]|uniref:Hydrolase n=1 Tax=Cohnella abietis TaxID=2507935 RepID=A0A3T1D8T1_9BACL|nr:HAD family hydrolase [Cohnella abietis]BBI34502.1 hydrolase [Cohnella abietis]